MLQRSERAFIIIGGGILLFFGAAACSGHGQPSSEPTANISAALTLDAGGADGHVATPVVVTLTAPNPLSPLAPVLTGETEVILASSSAVVAGTVVAMGTGQEGWGVKAETGSQVNGDSWSVGPAKIEDGVTITGTLHARSVLLEQPTSVANFDKTPSLDPPSNLTWTVTYPQTGPDVTLTDGQAQTLAPGSYGTLTLHSNANLILSTGTYYLTNLSSHSGVTVSLNQAAGPIVIYISNEISVNYDAGPLPTFIPIEPPDAGYVHADVMIAYLGTNALSVDSPFDGALIAPFASLKLGSATGVYYGYYYGQSIESEAQVQYQFPSALAMAVANSSVAQLQQDTGVSWVLTPGRPSPAVELTALLRPTGDPGVALPPGTNPQGPATAFLQKYADIFSIQDPTTELVLQAAYIDPSGMGYATFQQVVNGVPVLGAGVTVMFNANGRINNVSSHYIPGIFGMSTTPAINAAAALASAQADLATRFPSGTLGATLPGQPAVLFIAPQPTGIARLAYNVAAIFAGQVDQTIQFARNYVIDALTGAVLSSADAAQRQARNVGGAPVQASGQGTIEQTRNLKQPVRQFTAWSQNPPTGGPFDMQLLSATPEIFVDEPKSAGSQEPVTIMSNDLMSWDTAGIGRGAAVDAYFYFNDILSWWAARGRTSFDNNGGTIDIFVHDGNTFCDAEWSPDDKKFNIGDCTPSVYPFSVGLDILGHEFQHAINDSVFHIDQIIAANTDPDAAPLDESLGDVFGQFIESSFPAGALSYAATPELMGEGPYALMPHASGAWIRNLVDPHFSGASQPASPDSLTDCLYNSNNPNGHVNAGIPNRAWSIATFGGIDSTTGYGVDPSGALGMDVSEQLYQMLISMPPLLGSQTPGQMFFQLGQALVSNAVFYFGPVSPQVQALACAWYGAGVFLIQDVINLGFDPTSQCAIGATSPCQSAAASAPTQASCGTGSQAITSCAGTPCPNAPSGLACSTDGATLYMCDGSGDTTGGTPCSNGCSAAACLAAGPAPVGGGGTPCSSLLPGTYCGGNGRGASNILYTCSGTGIVSNSTVCGGGCQMNTVPAGGASPPPSLCNQGLSCVGLPEGYYCGNDKVCGELNVLYHCDSGAITSVLPCPMGCSILSTPSQFGGADNCTGPSSTQAGKDSCKPGPQTTVPSGTAQNNCPPGQTPPDCCPVGDGPCRSASAVGGSPLGPQTVICSAQNPGENSLSDGLYCGPDNTITRCLGGVNEETQTCPAGCMRNGNGLDACVGGCAEAYTGYECASDHVTILQCDLTAVVGQKTCSVGCETLPEFGGLGFSGFCISPPPQCVLRLNGSNCASDGKTLLDCENQYIVDQETCAQGCQYTDTGMDTCIGPCTNLPDGRNCSTDGTTLLQCMHGNVIGQQPCATGCQGGQTGTSACTP